MLCPEHGVKLLALRPARSLTFNCGRRRSIKRRKEKYEKHF
nr:MAG TPA: hypothetical protein [Caudoviricetes sp.]